MVCGLKSYAASLKTRFRAWYIVRFERSAGARRDLFTPDSFAFS
jgi:hypothetical protein